MGVSLKKTRKLPEGLPERPNDFRRSGERLNDVSLKKTRKLPEGLPELPNDSGTSYDDGTEMKELSKRRRLSSGEKFLHRLRQTTPHRDPPVLTGLLEEIREADKK